MYIQAMQCTRCMGGQSSHTLMSDVEVKAFVKAHAHEGAERHIETTCVDDMGEAHTAEHSELCARGAIAITVAEQHELSGALERGSR